MGEGSRTNSDKGGGGVTVTKHTYGVPNREVGGNVSVRRSNAPLVYLVVSNKVQGV